MRLPIAVTLVFAVGAVPVFAQHGGGGHSSGSAGFHGGSSGRAGVVAHSGGASQGGSARYAGGSVVRSGVQGNGQAGHLYSPGSFSGSRPVFYSRGRSEHSYGGRLGTPYAYPVPLENGYLDYGVLDNGYSDDGGDYDDSANGPVEDSGVQGQGDDAGPQGPGYQPQEQGYPAAANYPPQGPSYQAGGSGRRAAVVRAQTVAPALYDSDAVTLVFKDGRPVETIHNYALTRTTLYVTDAHRQEIPVAALDLAATEKANREAGVSFQLPVTGR